MRGRTASDQRTTPAPESAPLTVSEVLSRAADLIAPPGAWTTGGWARDARGGLTASDDPRAVCWCAQGALMRCAGWTDKTIGGALGALKTTLGFREPFMVARWNDAPERTQAEVVAALRKASELAASEASAKRPRTDDSPESGSTT